MDIIRGCRGELGVSPGFSLPLRWDLENDKQGTPLLDPAQGFHPYVPHAFELNDICPCFKFLDSITTF